MEWVTALNKVIGFIEKNLKARISAADCAREAAISEFHLQRGFRIITGFSLGEYVRNRRLYEAAIEVADTDRSILDIALDYQYETAESFTKAFRRFHGSTPSQVRSAGAGQFASLVVFFLPAAVSIHVTGGSAVDYEVVSLKGFTVIGFEREFSFEDSYSQIPKFWDEVWGAPFKRLWDGKKPETDVEKAVVENRIGEFGVCIDDVGGGKFRYLIAGAYKGGGIPAGMVTFDVPAGGWAKFRARGALPDSLQKVNTFVFREWLPGNPDWDAAGWCSIEWYSDGEPDSADYQSEIWIPVKKRQ
ncbi:MAG: AraC family transcriptional regulator [Treponemataceae bacterium]|nr:AraC family transcriptional regulator [Treponemataceae bacterium]